MLPQDPCTSQHTAANDVRGRQTWQGFDETGLMGMACRHDHLLKLINIVQTGERCVVQTSRIFLEYSLTSLLTGVNTLLQCLTGFSSELSTMIRLPPCLEYYMTLDVT